MKILETNLTVMVKNMDNSIKWYENIGFKLKNRWGDHYAMLDSTGITLGLHPAEEKPEGSGSVSVGLMIESATEAKKLLEKNKIAFTEREGKSGHYLHFKDPDNTIIYFVEPAWK